MATTDVSDVMEGILCILYDHEKEMGLIDKSDPNFSFVVILILSELRAKFKLRISEKAFWREWDKILEKKLGKNGDGFFLTENGRKFVEEKRAQEKT